MSVHIKLYERLDFNLKKHYVCVISHSEKPSEIYNNDTQQWSCTFVLEKMALKISPRKGTHTST